MNRWHFRMLNDANRNSAFKKAIQYWMRKSEKVDVMDIGSGTGLLSMYAANVACVKSIYAIECNPVMNAIATEVFKENLRGKLVKLITKHSMDLEVGEDVPSKVSVIVSETLDSGVFGEGILDTLIHAKQHLLQDDGKIVPWKVKIHVAGYKSKTLCASSILMNETFFEYLFLGNVRLVARRDEPYDAEYVDKITDFKLITDSVSTIEIDFNDLSSMQQHFDGTVVKEFGLHSTVKNDYIDGFVTWFTLYLNEMDEENFIKTEPKSGSCWNQAIFKLRERVLLEKDGVVELKMACKDGVLKIHQMLDEKSEKDDIEVDANVLRFLNDDEYLRELEFVVGKHKNKIVNCLDLSPFPYVGLLLLKDGRAEKLWCSKRNEEAVRMIAARNVIEESRLVFLAETDVPLEIKFQLIILHLFYPLGDLDNEMICAYQKYRELLADGGLIIPRKITLFGELINSDWLVESCRITDIGVKRLKIDKFINNYATEVQVDLDGSLDCEKLTSAFKISEIYFDDELHETSINVLMRNINSPIHAILFHHKIQLALNVPEIATNRKSQACFKLTARVLEKDFLVNSSTAKISFIQNSGIVKCDVLT